MSVDDVRRAIDAAVKDGQTTAVVLHDYDVCEDPARIMTALLEIADLLAGEPEVDA